MATEPLTSLDSTDPSPYIRTYAKDVAAITGQKPGTISAGSYDVSQSSPKKDDTLLVSSAPSAKPADLKQLQRDAERMDSKKESAQEAEERLQDMGNAASSGILQSISLPSIKPGDIVQGSAPISAPVEQSAANREEVLARLRAKVAGARQASEPLMPSSFPVAPIVYEQPIFTEPVAPLPPPVPVQPTAPLAPVVETPAPEPFHSFSSDFADRIDQQHASTFSVLAAEKDSPMRKAAPVKKHSNLLPILAGIVLVIIGAAGVFAAYRFMTATAPVASISISYLIVPDEKVGLSGSGPTLLQTLSQQASQPIPSDTVLLTYLNSATSTIASDALFNALNLPAPNILLRNIDPSSIVGIVNDGTQTRPFFILRVDSYESTFAGMLDWEPTMASDLSLLYPTYPAPVQTASTVATSTATTTTETKTTATTTVSTSVSTQTLPVGPLEFIDEVVANHNARALKDAEGRTLIIYGYADQQTLVIARDEAAFTLLLGRLEASQQ